MRAVLHRLFARSLVSWLPPREDARARERETIAPPSCSLVVFMGRKCSLTVEKPLMLVLLVLVLSVPQYAPCSGDHRATISALPHPAQSLLRDGFWLLASWTMTFAVAEEVRKTERATEAAARGKRGSHRDANVEEIQGRKEKGVNGKEQEGMTEVNEDASYHIKVKRGKAERHSEGDGRTRRGTIWRQRTEGQGVREKKQ
eukprot:1287084-Rhodomonas_salina.1